MILMPAIAEIGLAICALVTVLGGVFSRPSHWKAWTGFAMLAIAGMVWLAATNYTGEQTAFSDMFVQDALALGFKALIAFGGVLALILSIPFFDKRQEGKFEYPLLVMLATIGMFGMVSSQDFLALYISLELQSLSLYVLASFRRDHKLNSEAGLKYFFLGALSSGLLLYGISLLYGFTGSTDYITIANTLAQSELTTAQLVAMVLTLSGLIFKISAAPFHMWTPDVYQGSSTPVTALFAMAPKAAAIGVLCRLITGPLLPVFDQMQQILIVIAILSLLVGAFAGVVQKNVKRLMAYSSIGHMGFIVMALSVAGEAGVKAAFFYTALYIIMSACAFSVLLAVYDEAEGNEDMAFLSGLSKQHPILAFSFAAVLLSMAGIPPLAGFLAKFYVLNSVLQSDMVLLAVIAVLCSVVAAYYYLRLIKTMYFDAAKKQAPQMHAVFIYQSVALLSALALIILLVCPSWIGDWAQWVVTGL